MIEKHFFAEFCHAVRKNISKDFFAAFASAGALKKGEERRWLSFTERSKLMAVLSVANHD